MKVGDQVTFSGDYRNWKRKWWQFWKPRMVKLAPFTVTAVYSGAVQMGPVDRPHGKG